MSKTATLTINGRQFSAALQLIREKNPQCRAAHPAHPQSG